MKYILIFLSCFIVFVANAEPSAKDVNVINTPDINVARMPSVEVLFLMHWTSIFSIRYEFILSEIGFA